MPLLLLLLWHACRLIILFSSAAVLSLLHCGEPDGALAPARRQRGRSEDVGRGTTGGSGRTTCYPQHETGVRVFYMKYTYTCVPAIGIYALQVCILRGQIVGRGTAGSGGRSVRRLEHETGLCAAAG